ncbi:hypothetical protein BTJ39_15895 [Izhakiella australiensis]|uniref:Uncharacterized protein n=1 Tax=Izhakiella australiensis TaxID=1926881 RepID=A0A1S8YJD7_9GAMM|nr:hypothetical protein [Izhakiella australiensis]OON38846.1 hypothetical protein BTJ39_15895 [Izhakiella australiensis]
MNTFNEMKKISLAIMLVAGSINVAQAAVIDGSINTATADLVFNETVISSAAITPETNLFAGQLNGDARVATARVSTEGANVAWRWTPASGIVGIAPASARNHIVISGKNSPDNKLELYIPYAEGVVNAGEEESGGWMRMDDN